LFLVITVAVGIGEGYHPDSAHRPWFPTTVALFIPSVLFLLTSLLAWLKWRRVTGKKIGATLVSYVFVLSVSGAATYFLTDTNPEYRTYEHLGYTYEIPRVYNPSQYWSPSTLEIRVCDERPDTGVYDNNSRIRELNFPCSGVAYKIEPIQRILQVPIGLGWTKSGKWGFTMGTSSQGLVLTGYDPDVAKENNLERIENGNTTIIRSATIDSPSVSVGYREVIYLETEENVVKWFTVCRGRTCNNYQPLPGDSQYVVTTSTTDEFFRDAGSVSNRIWHYKERSEQALRLFDSFRVSEG
jgi:hypothetical protein